MASPRRSGASSAVARTSNAARRMVRTKSGCGRDARVLDLGAGNGRHAKILSHRGNQAVALDFSLPLLMIGRARERGTAEAMRIDWVGGEATKLPFRDASFDAGLCIAVLHHLPLETDRLAALGELRRVLRQQAPVFLSVWAREQ